MAGTIGIKLANGDFYPIMGDSSTVKKRLVLTTVHDGQKSVQIDLFRSVSKTMLDAQYVGSLVVEDIKPRSKGEPSIEMIISSDSEGNIIADACDLDAGSSGKRQTLNVSHKKIDSMDRKSDFNVEPKLYSRKETSYEGKRKSPWLIMVVATLFIIIAIILLWFFFLGGRDSVPREWLPESVWNSLGHEQTEPYVPPPPPPPEPPPPPPPPPPPEPPPEPVVIQAPVEPPPARPAVKVRTRPPAPVSSYKVPAVIPRNGVAYQLRWGDTLWEISEAFYRNPWLYPRIARYNNISNPDHIISGRTIRIPPLD